LVIFTELAFYFLYIIYVIYTYKRHIRSRGNKKENTSLSNNLKRKKAKHIKKESE